MGDLPAITLSDGVHMPQLGFGVFKVPAEQTAAAVATALAAGYRSIDTARLYDNETEVGQALAAAGVPRQELFITTKVWNSDQGYEETLRAFDDSLDRLKLEYLDLYLIHWPAPARDRYVASWRALERLRAERRVRAIGVSNFQPAHLDRLVAETGTVPAVNQVELHPFLQQIRLRGYHNQHRIVTEAWSPLAKGGELLRHPAITAIANKHGRTPAQVVLRWHLHLGNVVIPKSVTPSRIRENIDVFDFKLDSDDLTAISGLDQGRRTGPDPDRFNGG